MIAMAVGEFRQSIFQAAEGFFLLIKYFSWLKPHPSGAVIKKEHFAAAMWSTEIQNSKPLLGCPFLISSPGFL